MNSNKLICVIYGNCHMDNVYEGLKSQKYFSQVYDIYYYFIGDIKDPDIFLGSRELRECDLLISQYIRDKNSFGEKFSTKSINNRIKEECRCIFVPNLYWLPMCFFPQAVKGGRIFDKRFLVWTINFYEDELIEHVLVHNYPIKKAVERYENINTYSADFLKNSLSEFIGKVEEREMNTDVHISKYLIGKFRDKRLFYDPGHPTEVVTGYYVYEILSILGMKADYMDIISNIIPIVGKMIPICESVKMTFDIGDDIEGATMRKVDLLPGKNMVLKKYIYEYCGLRWTDRLLPMGSRIRCFAIYIVMLAYAVPYTILRMPKYIKKRNNNDR